MKFFIYTLLFSIVFSLYARLQVCVNYFANQSYYATVLCENKDVKNSCCKGKCSMGKQLGGLDKKEAGNAKNQQPLLKLGKAEEALNERLSLGPAVNCINLMYSEFSSPIKKEDHAVALRPPTYLA